MVNSGEDVSMVDSGKNIPVEYIGKDISVADSGKYAPVVDIG